MRYRTWRRVGCLLSFAAAAAACSAEDPASGEDGARHASTAAALSVTAQPFFVPSDPGSEFGHALALSGDTALVGDPIDDQMGPNAGVAYVFTRSGDVWIEQAKLLAGDAAPLDHFGWSVALSGDTAVVGAYYKTGVASHAGAAYVFGRSGGLWTQQAQLVPNDTKANASFGSSVAVEGDTIVVGAEGDSNLGAAYVFGRSGGVWTQQAKLVPSDTTGNIYFGGSVSLSGDTILVGATGNDAAYVFVGSGSAWAEQAKLTPSDGTTEEDLFAKSVSLSGDTALVGAPWGNSTAPYTSTGVAYVFARAGGAWTQQARLLGSDSASGDRFGESVSLSGDIAAVGSVYHDIGASNAGAAYMFVRTGVAWTQQAMLLASNAGSLDQLGQSVAVGDDIVLAGAPGALPSNNGAGYAFTYAFSPPQIDGFSCAADVECLSGFCVDGVCCDTACGLGSAGDCLACSAAAGAQMNGVCAVTGGTLCRGAASACDAPEVCDGASPQCPPDVGGSAGTVCRPAASPCDVAETCDGAAPQCPPDAVGPAGIVCRPLAGPCDLAEEVCDGVSPACPADQFANHQVVCRPVAGPCDAAETCDGQSPDCPGDYFYAGTVCRSSKGFCDLPEYCGYAPDCPPDLLKLGTVCRAAIGECDLAESCDGVSPYCPDDELAAGTVCRASLGPCDVAEACTGASPACPTDAHAASGTVCRPADGSCDVTEACDGASPACPADAVQQAGTACRAPAGPCDVAEACDGQARACPPDEFASGTVCRPQSNACDVEEVCEGTSATCPPDEVVQGGACPIDPCPTGDCTGEDEDEDQDEDQEDEAGCGCRVAGSRPVTRGGAPSPGRAGIAILALAAACVARRRRRDQRA